MEKIVESTELKQEGDLNILEVFTAFPTWQQLNDKIHEHLKDRAAYFFVGFIMQGLMGNYQVVMIFRKAPDMPIPNDSHTTPELLKN